MSKNFRINNNINNFQFNNFKENDINEENNEINNKLKKFQSWAQKGKEIVGGFKKNNEIDYKKFEKKKDEKNDNKKVVSNKENTFLTNTNYKKNKVKRELNHNTEIIDEAEIMNDPIEELKKIVTGEEDDLEEIRRMIGEVDSGLSKHKKEFNTIENSFSNLKNDLKKKKFNMFFN